LEITGKPASRIRLPDTTGVDATGIGGLIAMLEALQRVQDACGESFPVPEHRAPREQALLHFADLLIRAEPATWPWPGCLITLRAEQVRTLLATGALPRMGVTGKGATPGAS
jgi:hypothetical protein